MTVKDKWYKAGWSDCAKVAMEKAFKLSRPYCRCSKDEPAPPCLVCTSCMDFAAWLDKQGGVT